LSDDEISRVIASVATSEPQFVKELVQLKAADGTEEGPKLDGRDELYDAALDVVIREGRGSVSLLQRTLGIGYGRAARLIDYMAEDGIVGAYNGSQAREVLVSLEEWDQMNGQAADQGPAPAKPRHGNKILLGPPAREREAVDEAAPANGEYEDEDGADEAEDQEELEEDNEAEAYDGKQEVSTEEEHDDEAYCEDESEYEEDDLYDEDEPEYEEKEEEEECDESDEDEEEGNAEDCQDDEPSEGGEDAKQRRWAAERA
jgi:S-DNA-T family DNA segregation ATPase FtsK/SpoIIIE